MQDMADGQPTLFVVIGWESSGSQYVANVLSTLLQKPPPEVPPSLEGFSWLQPEFDPSETIAVLHASLPHSRPKLWMREIDERIALYRGFSVRYVVCCRDLTISRRSRQIRFGGKSHEYAKDDQKARDILSDIVRQKDCFVFSYESALALEDAYFEQFASWVGAPLVEFPSMTDGNRPYVKNRRLRVLQYEVIRRYRAFRHRIQKSRAILNKCLRLLGQPEATTQDKKDLEQQNSAMMT